MKQKITMLIAAALLASAALAQTQKKYKFLPGQKKPGLFGIAFTLSDFNAPKNFGNSNATTLPISEMSAGVSAFYWKGLTPFIDLSFRLNGIFHDYSANFYGIAGKTEIGLELEPTINIRPLKDENMWSPFLTAGVGGGIYTGHMGGYIPLGGGLQLNANSTTYFFLQAQYKWSITPKVLGNNVFYSLGFAQNVGGNDQASPKLAPAPPVVTGPVIKDTDGDGVPDETDACPEVKGVTAFKGCPDSDGDGIADKDDKCPEIKGLIKYDGCPIPDTDKDGINDEQDQCPAVAGLARYQGCAIPDTDNDGINDEEDKCPTVAGVASNMGCPEIAAATVDKINKAAASIFFATGSSKLLAKSNASLNSIAAILQANPDYKVDISGYTDNQGAAEKNKALSEARAKAVSDYLAKKGINADRLSAEGLGDENPIADNKTAAGRAKNRRVELKVRNY